MLSTLCECTRTIPSPLVTLYKLTEPIYNDNYIQLHAARVYTARTM